MVPPRRFAPDAGAGAQDLTRSSSSPAARRGYAALVGKFIIESLARVPVEVDYGSEFRYRDPDHWPRTTAVLAITQSGETVDTLAAMEEARDKGAQAVEHRQRHRLPGHRACRTASSTCKPGRKSAWPPPRLLRPRIVDQYLLALYLGQLRGTLDAGSAGLVDDLARLPDLVGQVLASDDAARARRL